MDQIIGKYASAHSRGGWAVSAHHSDAPDARQEDVVTGRRESGTRGEEPEAAAGPAPMHRPEQVDDAVWQPSSRPSYYGRVINSSHDPHCPGITPKGSCINAEHVYHNVRPSNSPKRRLGSGLRGRNGRQSSLSSYPPKLSSLEQQILERGTMRIVYGAWTVHVGGVAKSWRRELT